MDPLEPSSFNLQTTKIASGRRYQYCDQVPMDYKHGETPVMLLVHGFPELWYNWRYQIGPWVHRGWRVVAPNMLGYGETDKPEDIALYTPLSIAADLAGLLDALDIKKPVIVVSHDWGSADAWAFSERYTERTRMMISISITYQPALTRSFTVPEMVEYADPNFLGYWLFFNSKDGAAKIDRN
ncbi:hypothetical protein FRB96_003891, partial [Tulasnella sp. 330]